MNKIMIDYMTSTNNFIEGETWGEVSEVGGLASRGNRGGRLGEWSGRDRLGGGRRRAAMIPKPKQGVDDHGCCRSRVCCVGEGEKSFGMRKF